MRADRTGRASLRRFRPAALVELPSRFANFNADCSRWLSWSASNQTTPLYAANLLIPRYHNCQICRDPHRIAHHCPRSHWNDRRTRCAQLSAAERETEPFSIDCFQSGSSGSMHQASSTNSRLKREVDFARAMSATVDFSGNMAKIQSDFRKSMSAWRSEGRRFR